MPTLAGLARDRAGDSGFAVVAVSMDKPDKTEAAKAFIAGLKEPNLVFYQDPTSQLAFALQSPGLPTTILYDRQGREIARLAGSADWSGADAKALIEAALAQP
jgi:thiol-disulfide isomerase/thioredoxin